MSKRKNVKDISNLLEDIAPELAPPAPQTAGVARAMMSVADGIAQQPQTQRAPSRVGKMATQINNTPDDHYFLKGLSNDYRMPVEKMWKLAMNEWLVRQGHPTITV